MPQQTQGAAKNRGAKVVLITGASSGIGRTCAEYLAGKGMIVFGTSRSLATGGAGPFHSLRMDVTDDESVQQGVRQVHEQSGRIDVGINWAGDGIAGAVEESSPREAMGQFETNFFAVHRVCRAVIPLRRQHRH